MPSIKLTERIIPGLKGRPATDKSKEPIIYFDAGMPGFGISVSTKTGLKSYIVQRDLPNGRTRRITLGLVGGEIKTLEQARELAGEKIREMRSGIDPKAIARTSITLKQAAEAYLAARPNLAENSIRDYRRVFDVYLKDWGGDRLSEITRDMVERRHLELGKQTGQATANLTMRSLRAVFNWAIDRYPDVTANPVRLHRQWFKVLRRERHVSADQLPVFYNAVLKLENKVQRDYLLLLLFTGLRSKEAASLTWQDVDFTAKVIRFPALRTKAKRKLDLPMSDVVFRMLKERRAIGDAHYVFPAHGKTGHIASPKHPFELVAEACDIRVSPHDLRRTFAKAAITAGIHTMVLKGLLNHAVGESDVTAGYVILSENDLREPMQRTVNVLKTWCRAAQAKPRAPKKFHTVQLLKVVA
jgi:integrase